MKTLTIKIPKGQLDGAMIPTELDLQTFAPVVIVGAKFSTSARIIICENKNVQQAVINTNYQMMAVPLPGILFELASDIIWSYFDFTDFCKSHDQSRLYRYPLDWQPVLLQAKLGKLPVVIEARTGNHKHKAYITVELYTQG